ncbi:hypothetical protein JHK85_053429 [Glycine max]|nr:hypothetical protein JHK85_053429 [Glycine max]
MSDMPPNTSIPPHEKLQKLTKAEKIIKALDLEMISTLLCMEMDVVRYGHGGRRPLMGGKVQLMKPIVDGLTKKEKNHTVTPENLTVAIIIGLEYDEECGVWMNDSASAAKIDHIAKYPHAESQFALTPGGFHPRSSTGTPFKDRPEAAN